MSRLGEREREEEGALEREAAAAAAAPSTKHAAMEYVCSAAAAAVRCSLVNLQRVSAGLRGLRAALSQRPAAAAAAAAVHSCPAALLAINKLPAAGRHTITDSSSSSRAQQQVRWLGPD